MVVVCSHARLPSKRQAFDGCLGTAGLELPVPTVGGGRHERYVLAGALDELPLDFPPAVTRHREVQIAMLAFGAPVEVTEGKNERV